jgi:F-type H+-transporting ATPase subunit alpha
LFAANEGFLRDIPVEKILDFEAALISYMNAEHAAFMTEVNTKGAYTPEVIDTMRKAVETFKSTQTW